MKYRLSFLIIKIIIVVTYIIFRSECSMVQWWLDLSCHWFWQSLNQQFRMLYHTVLYTLYTANKTCCLPLTRVLCINCITVSRVGHAPNLLRQSETPFKTSKIVAKYILCVETPFWHRGANICRKLTCHRNLKIHCRVAAGRNF